MKFNISRKNGIRILSIEGCSSIRAIEIKGSVHIQNSVNNSWIYCADAPVLSSIDEAKSWLQSNVDNISNDDFQFIMNMYGARNTDNNLWVIDDVENFPVEISYHDGIVRLSVDPFDIQDPDSLVKFLDKISSEDNMSIMLCYREYRNNVIECAISSRDLTKNMVRVKSSNVWAYNINIKDRKDKFGDVVVQFKDAKGGPGDIYMYFDVPIMVYRRWHTAPSKGHYFWQYIRNNYNYRKLTGDKKGKLRNAIN